MEKASVSNDLKNIHLYNFHKAHGAKFAPFAGFNMPISYSNGIINENFHVRKKAGVFDVSHMGQIIIEYNETNILNLEKFIPLQLKKISTYRSYYSFLLNSSAGIIDDIIITKIDLGDKIYFFIVYNASRKEIVQTIFKKYLTNISVIQDRCLFAIQGPLSFHTLSKILNINEKMKFLDFKIINYNNKNMYISRSGYTGEDGFEISILKEDSENLISKLIKSDDIILCGLGSRDSLRLEAGLSLYGNELNENITPIEANLLWAVDLQRLKSSNLNGNKYLTSQIKSLPKIKKIGITAINKIMMRNNMDILDINNNIIGNITSGGFSPNLSKSIAIGYIKRDFDHINKLFCKVRNNLEPLTITKLPFVKKNYKKE